MRARIFQRPKTSQQSGHAHTGDWVLEYQPAERELALQMVQVLEQPR